MGIKILWIDDEIDLLKPHGLFLEKKGYEMTMINNATDAIELLQKQNFSVVLIDENMPGLGGLDALVKIKEIRPNLPVVMITKNEEEHIMEEAIGKHISDYLIKPVNPNQILLSLKKILDRQKIITEKTSFSYQQEFRSISGSLMDAKTYEDWIEIHKKLVYWELELETIQDQQMLSILKNQKEEANSLFFRFVQKSYHSWLHTNDKPILSHEAFQHFVRPHLAKDKKVLLVVIDNLRFDQWKSIDHFFRADFNITQESIYFSILPSATQYARNAFFSGLMPSEIDKKYPNHWLNDDQEGGKNLYEQDFLIDQLKRLGLSDLSASFYKILNSDFEKKILDDFHKYKKNNLTTIVYNFIDILSHAKTDNRIIAELIRDDKTYRALTVSWFEHSHLLEIIKSAGREGIKVLITTDHGTTFVKEPSRVVGDRDTSTNLRYKLGRKMVYEEKDVFVIDNPEQYFLPKSNLTSKYIFAKPNLFFAYPQNYAHYVNYYKNTYQHGGISLDEIIIPFVTLEPK